MSGDVWSELPLTAVALIIAIREIKMRPGMALGTGLIGVASLLGIFSFSGIKAALGPHDFVSLLAACVGMPLLAISLYWKESIIATKLSAAVRFFLVVSAISVILVPMLNFGLWSSITAAASALLIFAAALRSRLPVAIAGSVILVACFTLSAGNWVLAPLNADQQLHVLMAISLALLAIRWQSNQVSV
jgi:hypothetical protein